jgi:predicted metalloprotease
MAGGGIGVIVIALLAMFLGVDPRVVLQQVPSTSQRPDSTTVGTTRVPGEDQLVEFVSVVLADTEDTWHELFRQQGVVYQEPKLVLFSDTVNSACGFAQAAMGPFYCPADQKVYIDLSFYRDLKDQHQAPGDFAQAYVIAHEVGHHVQTLLGVSQKVHALKSRMTQTEANQLSVRQELQADCFAGVWAHHAHKARQVLEQGDIEEALNAASSIGDDRLQRRSGGSIVPESFTHGSSAQRVRWFKQGIERGSLDQCNTFQASRL